MALAINIRSDNESSNRIRGLWKKSSTFEESASMEKLNYPPHITLAIYDDVDEKVLTDALKSTFCKKSSIKLSFNRVDFFDVHPLVLYAKPELTQELLSLHSEIHNFIGADLSREFYQPNKWIPHCSLALDISEEKRTEALQFAGQKLDRFTVNFDTADVVSFPPVRVIREIVLS